MSPIAARGLQLRPSRGLHSPFSVEVEDVQLPTGTRLDILVNGAYVGQMAVSARPPWARNWN
ncbi:MAG: hypothetical protein IPJ98_12675 [Bryobacterales bacterium]|nr:hypothetical protein [Bryobacterales bacterium]